MLSNTYVNKKEGISDMVIFDHWAQTFFREVFLKKQCCDQWLINARMTLCSFGQIFLQTCVAENTYKIIIMAPEQSVPDGSIDIISPTSRLRASILCRQSAA
jgi:hypothetical protein